MRIFRNPYVRNGQVPTCLKSLDNCRKYFKDQLGVPEAVTSTSFWQSLSPKDYTKIYTEVAQRIQTYKFPWEELTLTDSVLLLGNLEELFQLPVHESKIVLDKKLLDRAAELSVLDVIQFLVEKQGIEPNNTTLMNALRHNKHDVINYLARKTGTTLDEDDLFIALSGHNFSAAGRMAIDGISASNKTCIDFIRKKDLLVLKFLVKPDSDSENIELFSYIAYKHGWFEGFSYLVEECNAPISEKLLSLNPKDNADLLKGYVSEKMLTDTNTEPQHKGIT